jgi:hypothetical protein
MDASKNDAEPKTIIDLGYMSIEEGVWENDDDDALDESQIVISEPKASVCFDYPLSGEFMFTFTADDPKRGFSRKEISEKIMKQYHKIYKEEDEAVGDPGMLSAHSYNRARSKGPYGIWGHYIGDLQLHTLYVESKPNQAGPANYFYSLGVDS